MLKLLKNQACISQMEYLVIKNDGYYCTVMYINSVCTSISVNILSFKMAHLDVDELLPSCCDIPILVIPGYD